MHEYSVVQGVLDSVIPSAHEAGALRVISVKLRVGTMTEIVEDSLLFMWDLACEERGAIVEGSVLTIEHVEPISVCMECGLEFEHDRLHKRCPECGSARTLIKQGRELEVASIDVELPD